MNRTAWGRKTYGKCRVSGCARDAVYKGAKLCKAHYMRWWTHDDPEYDARAYLKSTRSPTSADLHWAAGFLEGEGCFTRNHTSVGCPAVSASQINLEPLARLREFLGGSISSVHSRGNRQGHFAWQISGQRARGVMMTLYKLLSQKRQQAILAALEI